MLVTDKQYYMEPMLLEKLELMIGRSTNGNKDDNVVLIDGDEGQGKTNLEMGILYYIHHRTQRPFSLNNIFFDLDALIKFASETEEQLIGWDEGALGGLASEWWKKNQIKFIKLLMICRKKRHFIVICIPKFFKLNEYLVVDRSIALIHVYSRKNIHKGRFLYFTKAKKEKLWHEWRRSRRRSYQEFQSFHGTFGIVEDIVYDDKEYNEKKDNAILNFDNEGKQSKVEQTLRQKLKQLKSKIANIDIKSIKSKVDLAKAMGIERTTLDRWMHGFVDEEKEIEKIKETEDKEEKVEDVEEKDSKEDDLL